MNRLLKFNKKFFSVKMLKTPPMAQRIEHRHSYFGKTIEDNYHWLKDQNSEKRLEIIQYLNVTGCLLKIE